MVQSKDLLTTNEIRTYYALDEAMLKAHRKGDVEFAESTARSLLENADLPLLIRARACIVLGCSEQDDFLNIAKEGVRIAELALSQSSNPGKLVTQLVADSKTVLKDAQEAFDKRENEEDEGEGELVWEAGAEEDEEDNAVESKEEKKK